MADTAQINPKIKLATKVRLLAFCKDRGHSQADVVEAALEAYFTPVDGDAQTLMFEKLNTLEHGMKDVVTLLGTVIGHLEKQAKPPPPRIATAAELYPALHAPLDPAPEVPLEEEAPPPKRSVWQKLCGRRAAP